MFEIAVLTPEGTVKLPQEIRRNLSPSDRFVVWMEGDTLHLKKMEPSPLDRVVQMPVDEPLSMDEINEIVHEVRRQHHQK